MILPGFKLYASNKVKIYNESERFLDIEAQTDQLRIDLSDVDKKTMSVFFDWIFLMAKIYIFSITEDLVLSNNVKQKEMNISI